MKSWLSLIPVSAKLHRSRSRMTGLCIVVSVFLVSAVFSMAEAAARQETARLLEKHGAEATLAVFSSRSFRSLLPIAAALFLFVLCAAVLMISGSMNSQAAQRTRFFGMLRCIGMSRRQLKLYVRLEALYLCLRAVPLGLLAGTAASWLLCAVLKYGVGGEWADIPQLGVSLPGIVGGTLTGLLTVLLASGKPARKAAATEPVSALSGAAESRSAGPGRVLTERPRIERALGIRHAAESPKNLLLMVGSFTLSIVLFLSFSVFVDLVNRLMPQSASAADLELYAEEDGMIDGELPGRLRLSDGVKRAFGRRAVFEVPASCPAASSLSSADVISFEDFDLDALKKDGLTERGCDLEAVKSGRSALLISDEAIAAGDDILVFGETLRVAGKLKYDPFGSDGSTGGRTTLIVSDKSFREMSGSSGYTLVLVQLKRDATEDQIDAIRRDAGDGVRFLDCRENSTHGTYVAFLICSYAFLLIIAMVTILNIVNSLSMSVSARLGLYGVMRAVGMSKKQMREMIASEALTFAVPGCASGLVLGLISRRWLYAFLVTSHFPYAKPQFPFAGFLTVLVFFAVSVLAGIRGPIRRMDTLSITETVGSL